MRTITITAAMMAAMLLAACGGGGGHSPPVTVKPETAPEPEVEPEPSFVPLSAENNRYQIHGGATAADAKRSPIYFSQHAYDYSENVTRVGVDQRRISEQLPEITIPGRAGFEFRHGTIRDGAGAANLRDYLSSVDIDRRLPGYEVRIIGSSTAQEQRRVLAAVQLINASLPEERQAERRSTPAWLQPRGHRELSRPLFRVRPRIAGHNPCRVHPRERVPQSVRCRKIVGRVHPVGAR